MPGAIRTALQWFRGLVSRFLPSGRVYPINGDVAGRGLFDHGGHRQRGGQAGWIRRWTAEVGRAAARMVATFEAVHGFALGANEVRLAGVGDRGQRHGAGPMTGTVLVISACTAPKRAVDNRKASLADPSAAALKQ